ncbi:LLM class flavin-dependent oxidoreductase [Kutzneria sp. 744]|uniref:LLM class flavin-dependent oxidoreductase n=1 Tax=Kutzneria sp. (strain 744) TaxID=345341 RepID=UPI0003EEB280|nr:LLM class flavin-dependent oxidoreductase [Kutzneria sp. 744]EWM12206.1 phthiodiolone/phenolphthiodiolone dimycocerosates ketoreductase [Kutzneria sp. 744]
MRVGLAWDAVGPVEGGRGLLDLARSAGMDTFLVFDHLINVFPRQAWDSDFSYLAAALPSPDLSLEFATVLGNFASHAGPVRLAVGVTDPHRRHPAVLAQTALTLAQLTERPPIIGIGAGAQENLQPYGIRADHQVDRVEEALRILRMFFDTKGPHDFAGEFFTLDQAIMDLRRADGGVPELWVGGSGPRMTALAGRHGDGWLPSDLMSPAEYARRWAVVREAAVAADRDPDRIVASGGVPIVVAETDDAAWELAQARAIRYLALHLGAAQWRAHGVAHPFGEDYRGLSHLLPHRLTRTEVEQALAVVPDELVAEVAIVGSRRTVLDRIGELAEAGLQLPMLIPVSALASPEAAGHTVESLVWLAGELGSDRFAGRVTA